MRLYSAIMLMLFGGFQLSAQEVVEQTKNGRVEVRYNTEDLEDNIKVTYKASAKSKADFNLMKDFLLGPDNYIKLYHYCEKVKVIEKESQTNWTMYLWYDNPWPLSNSDCVQRVCVLQNDENKFVIKGVADADAYPDQGEDRLKLFEITYTLVKSDDGLVGISVESVFVPASSVPKMMLKSWFPDGPAGIIYRLEKGEA